MGREATYYGRLNPTNSSLFLPFYGVSSCAVNIMRTDNANATGEIYAQNIIPKVWDYDAQIFQSDTPAAIYGFAQIQQPGDPQYAFGLSTVSAAVEMGAGGALTLGGGNLAASTLPVSRLTGKSLHVPPAVSVTHGAFAPITALENAGLAWAVEGWVFRSAATGVSYLYIETNAAITSYYALALLTTGAIAFQRNGVALWTSAGTIPMSAWTHFSVSSNGTQITVIIGNAAGVTTAYAHGVGVVPDRCALNFSGLGQHYSANFVTYQHALTAAQHDRHHNVVSGVDYYSGGVFNQGGTMGQGASAQIIYANNSLPTMAAVGVGIWSVLLPLQGIGLIRTMGIGEYDYEIHTEESDV